MSKPITERFQKNNVIPAKAGIQVVNRLLKNRFKAWIPAFAGMTLYAGLTVLFAMQDLFAMAQRPNPDPNAPPPPAWISWAPLVVMLGVFYFFLIRPQSKQRKEKKNMLNNLKKGDKVITQGGLHATIVNTGAGFFEIKLNEDTKVKIQKSSVVDVVVDNGSQPQTAVANAPK